MSSENIVQQLRQSDGEHKQRLRNKHRRRISAALMGVLVGCAIMFFWSISGILGVAFLLGAFLFAIMYVMALVLLMPIKS